MFLLPSEKIDIPVHKSGIYAIVQARTGMVYVGRSVNLVRRLREHWRMSRSSIPLSNEACSYLYRAWRSGSSDWYMYVLEWDVSEESIADSEAKWINFFKATEAGNGFNLSAPTPYVKASTEFRARISAAQLGKKRGPLPEDTRRKISEAQKGKVCGPLSDEHKRRISEASRGKILSPEHRAKISAARLGKPFSDQHRKNISEAGKRRQPATLETRRKMSAVMSNKVRSAEHCMNISLSKRGVPNPKLIGRPVSAETRAKTAATIKATLARKKALAAQQKEYTVTAT